MNNNQNANLLATSILSPSQSEEIQKCYSQVEETCTENGLQDHVPVAVFVGMESSGKTTLVEAMITLPLGYSALGRATYAPILYRFRKGKNLPKKFRCMIKSFTDYQPNEISIELLSERIKDIMVDLKNKETISTEPIEVTIECSEPNTRSLTFVDTPGMYRTDIQRQSHMTPEQAERQKDMIRSIIDTYCSRPENLIVVVDDGSNHPGNVDTYANLVRRHDPQMERTIAVTTHLDTKFNDPTFTNPSNLAAVVDIFYAWSAVYNKELPFFVGLHSLDKSKNLQFDQERVEIINQCRRNETYTHDWIKHMKLTDTTLLSRLGLEKFKDRLAAEINNRFLKKSSTIMTILREAKKEIEEQILKLDKSTKSLKAQSATAMVNDYVNTFVSWYFTTFTGVLPNDTQSITKTIFEKYQKTGLEEINYLQDIRGCFLKWPDNQYSDEDFESYVANSDMLLSNGAQRLNRILTNLLVRIMSTEPRMPTNDELANLAGSDGKQKNVVDFNAAVAQFTRMEGERIFLDDGCKYIGKRVEAILVNHAEMVLEMMQKAIPGFATSTDFLNDFKAAIETHFAHVASRCVENIETHAKAIMSKIDVAAPQKAELAFHFLYGFDDANTHNIIPVWRDNYQPPNTASQPTPDTNKPAPSTPNTATSPSPNLSFTANKTPSFAVSNVSYLNSSNNNIDHNNNSKNAKPARRHIEPPKIDVSTKTRFNAEQRMATVGNFQIPADDIVAPPRHTNFQGHVYDQCRYSVCRQYSLIRQNIAANVEDAIGSVAEKITAANSQKELFNPIQKNIMQAEETEEFQTEQELESKYRWGEFTKAAIAQKQALTTRSKEISESIRQLSSIFAQLERQRV